MERVFSFILFLFVIEIGKCDKTILTIGALFHEDEEDLILAFKSSVQLKNMFLDDIKFKPEIAKVDKSDTFETHKIICNWTSHGNGLAAIIGPSSPKTSSMAQSIANTLEIPHIQMHWTQSKPLQYLSTAGTTINFYPEQFLLAESLANILEQLQWKTYVIIYENNDSLVRLQEILKLTKYNMDPITIRQLGTESDYRTILKEFKDELVYNIILECSVDVCFKVLSQAKEIGFLDYVYNYFLTNLDSHTLDLTHLEPKANITTVRIVDPTKKSVKQTVANWQMEVLHNDMKMSITPETIRTELALMEDAISHLIDSITELHEAVPILTEPLQCSDNVAWDEGDRIATFMKDNPKLTGTTGDYMFDVRGYRTKFTLDLVEFNKGLPEKIAEWTTEEPHSLNSVRSESATMETILGNLQKELVIVSSKLGPPYLVKNPDYKPDDVNNNKEFIGYSYDVIEAIASILNFTFEFRLNKDNTNGAYNKKTKSWNGIVRDLLDRKAHLAICDLTITEERRSVVDFSVPFMTLGISILYRKGKESEIALLTFLDPLENEVWLYILTFFAIVTVIMYMVTRMAPGDWENPQPLNKEPEELESCWTFKNCLWLMLGSTMSCGCDLMPKGISSRMAISMWWFLILIITNSYQANLAAFLTKTRMGGEIDSAEALAKQTKVKYGTVDGGSTQAFFRDAKNNKVYNKMWQDMIQAKPSVFEKTNEGGVKRILSTKNQGYAFLMESTQIEYEIARHCDLKQVGGRLDNKGYGIAMPVNSPYRTAISQAILKLQEDGTLTRLKTKWWKEELGAITCPEEVVQDLSFKFAHVRGTFYVTIIGIGVAFWFSIVDFLWNARKISVQEHVSFWQALKGELLFAIKLTALKKKVKKPPELYSNSLTKSIEELEVNININDID